MRCAVRLTRQALCQAALAAAGASRRHQSAGGGANVGSNPTNSFWEGMGAKTADQTLGAGDPKSSAAHSAFSQGEPLPDPLLYNVPVIAARTVGRDTEIMMLWQNLLGGRRIQVVCGVDGIGKSTIAAEFCDCVRRSQRFTCIQWFNGRRDVKDQLAQFFASMRGRKEKDILLVVDDVVAVEEVVALIPEHARLHVLLTTQEEVKPTIAYGVLSVIPISPAAVDDIFGDYDGLALQHDAVHAVMDQLGYVPLLVHIVHGLLTHGGATPQGVKDALDRHRIMADRVLSVSAALAVLVELGMQHLTRTYPECVAHLTILSQLNINEFSEALVDKVMQGAADPSFAQQCVEVGVLTHKWEESAYAMHPSVAKLLRARVTEGVDALDLAAKALNAMWPRRWRGMGSHLAYSLVWHTYALLGSFTERSRVASNELLASMDRSATFLSHGEGRNLKVAADLWVECLQAYKATLGASDATAVENRSEQVRIGRECGRLLHHLRDDRARCVLEETYSLACDVHGPSSTQAALILACFGPYMEASQEARMKLRDAVNVLAERLRSPDGVLGREEVQMMNESMFVLLVCEGQMCEEMGEKTPARVWNGLAELEQVLAASKAQKSRQRP